MGKHAVVTLFALAGLLCCSEGKGIDPAFAKNLTLYHVNPANYSAVPLNMNTGDLHGDMYFYLRSFVIPLECANPSPETRHDCDNQEVVSNKLTVNQVAVTVDSRFGEYAECNICVNGTNPLTHQSCESGKYVCNCGFSPDPCPTNAVGMRNLSVPFHHHNFTCSAEDPDWECWKENTVKKTKGFWYSTLEAGDCDLHPENCTWQARVVKRVDHGCHMNSFLTAVESYNPPCFTACGSHRNTSAPCWINCFYDTVLGPDARNSTKVAGVALELLGKAWETPFLSDNPLEGGCPPL